MIKEVVDVLNKSGAVVAVKTDTVYGLICNALDKKAVEKIYDIKNRERKKPLSIFVKDIENVKKYVDESSLTKSTYEIMEKYWPGALTIIFKRKKDMLSYVVCDSDGIGIRIPNDNFLRDVLDKVVFPIAQTSCNISGEEPLKTYKDIVEKFKDKVDLIVDGGEVIDNRPSTVISVEHSDYIILRDGDVKID